MSRVRVPSPAPIPRFALAATRSACWIGQSAGWEPTALLRGRPPLSTLDIDRPRSVVEMGHDGPAHLAISSQRPLLRGLGVYHGKRGWGVSVEFDVTHGPVTTLGVGQERDGTLTLIASEGETVPGPLLEIWQHDIASRLRLRPGRMDGRLEHVRRGSSLGTRDRPPRGRLPRCRGSASAPLRGDQGLSGRHGRISLRRLRAGRRCAVPHARRAAPARGLGPPWRAPSQLACSRSVAVPRRPAAGATNSAEPQARLSLAVPCGTSSSSPSWDEPAA